MYEHMTYEKILDNILKNIPSNVDKREGSIIYDAIAPCALELTHTYIEFDRILKETFANTSTREYLILRAKERGIYPKDSTKAILKGIFNINIPIGSRFSLDGLVYKAIEKIQECTYKMQCETAGVQGNKYFGIIIPINYIDGLEKAEIVELLIPAEDEEDTESIRNRYFNTFKSEMYGGNVKDYIEKTNSLQGVGSTKVTPVWAGGGTVKLTILNSDYNQASEELLDFVQQNIDPTKDGSGLGIAPIGHIVTVDTAKEVSININTSITFETSITFDMIEDEVYNIVNNYLLEVRKNWGDAKTSVVRIAKIESEIMMIDGVIDIQNTSINNSSSNLILDTFEIPVLKVGGIANV